MTEGRPGSSACLACVTPSGESLPCTVAVKGKLKRVEFLFRRLMGDLNENSLFGWAGAVKARLDSCVKGGVREQRQRLSPEGRNKGAAPGGKGEAKTG